MNQYQEEFGERKNKVLNLLQDTIEYLNKHNNTEDAIALNELKTNIENNLFSIVLIGEFSAGKSMFLNALMHKRILPSFSKEATATVNFLRHTSQAPNNEKGIVYYQDGKREVLNDLNKETIESVVSTRGDKENQSIAETVERVDLFLDNKFLKDGVMLVDSPGLNGVADNLADITQRQIKESHASIFMFSADHPGSKTDFEALRDLKRQCNSIFIVLNKIDKINEYESDSVESVLDNLKSSYKKMFAEDNKLPEIFPLASWFALAARDPNEHDPQDKEKNKSRCLELEKFSRMSAFEDRLWKYLTQGERAREQLFAPIKKIETILTDNRISLEKTITVLSSEQGADELNKQKEAIEIEIKKLNKERQKSSQAIKTRFNNVVRDCKDKVKARCDEIVATVENDIKNFNQVDELQAYAEDLVQSMDERCRRLVKSIDEMLRDDLMLIVEEESLEQLGNIEKSLEDSTGIKFELQPKTFKLTAAEVGKRMTEDNAEIERKRAETEKLEKEIVELDRKSFAAKKAERKLNELYEDIKSLNERRRFMEENFTPPPIYNYTKLETEYRSRGGLFGTIGDILFGKKEHKVERQVKDTTDRDEAILRQNQRIAKLDEEIAQAQRKAAEIKSDDDSDIINYEIEQKNIKLLQKRAEYEKSVLDYTEHIKTENKQAVNKMVRQIDSFVKDQMEESFTAIKKYIDKSKEKSWEVVEVLLSSRVDDELKHQQDKLTKLIEISQADAQERDKKLNEANESLNTIIQLMNRNTELQVEITESMNDIIEEA